jgi:transcriptional regulator with XRE-family HTH domain
MIRKTEPATVEEVVRARLRGLRVAQGYTLDDLAARSNLSASTISRIETGKRTISLDVLVPLCQALHTDVNSLLDTTADDEDVVIRPVKQAREGMVTWPLTREPSSTGLFAAKVRYEPPKPGHEHEPAVHPGHDWFFVLSGTIQLLLGDREILVKRGEAAEFSTMTPHRIQAHRGPAEVISVFDRDGQHAHLHQH